MKNLFYFVAILVATCLSMVSCGLFDAAETLLTAASTVVEKHDTVYIPGKNIVIHDTIYQIEEKTVTVHDTIYQVVEVEVPVIVEVHDTTTVTEQIVVPVDRWTNIFEKIVVNNNGPESEGDGNIVVIVDDEKLPQVNFHLTAKVEPAIVEVDNFYAPDFSEEGNGVYQLFDGATLTTTAKVDEGIVVEDVRVEVSSTESSSTEAINTVKVVYTLLFNEYGNRIKVVLTPKYRQVLKGADYVIAQGAEMHVDNGHGFSKIHGELTVKTRVDGVESEYTSGIKVEINLGKTKIEVGEFSAANTTTSVTGMPFNHSYTDGQTATGSSEEGPEKVHLRVKSVQFLRTEVESVSEKVQKNTPVYLIVFEVIGAEAEDISVEARPYYYQEMKIQEPEDQVTRTTEWKVSSPKDFQYKFVLWEYVKHTLNTELNEENILAAKTVKVTGGNNKENVMLGVDTVTFKSTVEESEVTTETDNDGWVITKSREVYNFSCDFKGENTEAPTLLSVWVDSYTLTYGDKTFSVNSTVKYSHDVVNIPDHPEQSGMEYVGSSVVTMQITTSVNDYPELNSTKTISSVYHMYR